MNRQLAVHNEFAKQIEEKQAELVNPRTAELQNRLGDADKLLHSLDSHLVQILSEIEEVAGAERRRELEESVRQEVAAYKRRRKHHIKQCELRMRNVSGEPDSE